MSLMFKVRDLLRPRRKILDEAAIKPGSSVLDFGCGPGSYLAPLAQLVGPSGRIYALDINPLAVQAADEIAARQRSGNLKTIQSDCATGLPEASMDVVLLYDVFHGLARPDDVLRELHRVLKPGGWLAFSDHHMKGPEIVAAMTKTGLFALSKTGKHTFSFSRIG
jgi:ubiquinone/menaquinone biosynthesis C-methylase UbiE